MAASVTLTQLISDVRLYADMRTSDQANHFVTDAEITRLINLAIKEELYDLLVQARGAEYYSTESTFATLADDQAAASARHGLYDLPADFYQLFVLSLEWAADDVEVLRKIRSRHDTIRYQNWSHWEAWSPKGYRLRAGQIEILPKPTSAVTMRLQYVPTFTDLASGGDTIDGVNGWEKLVALTVASELREIEEQSQGNLPNMIEKARARVDAMIAEREAEEALKVRDVQPEDSLAGEEWMRFPGRVTVL